MKSDLHKPLEELNHWLSANNRNLDLVVIGAFAIHLHGLQIRMTMDIDTIQSLNDDFLFEQIQKIGEKYGLPNWLNDQAENLILPNGFSSRLIENSNFSNIKLLYASRIDLIKLKVAAYFYRGDKDPKDKEDLKILEVTQNELFEAILFLEEKHQPDVEKFKEDFFKHLEKIKQELKNVAK